MRVHKTLSYTAEERALLQKRAASVGLLLGVMSSIMLLYRAVSVLGDFNTERDFNSLGAIIAHGVATIWLLGLWLACRGRSYSARTVLILEAVAFCGASVSFLAMTTVSPLWSRPENQLLLLNALVLLVRSVWVPSTALRTAFLGLAIGAPFLAGVYTRYAYGYDPEIYAPTISLRHVRAEELGAAIAVGMGLWWLIVVIACSATSRVIHGLRKQVRDIRKLGQYAIESKVGEGGMGVVYRARHAMLRRPTAVKLLPRSKAGEAAIALFEREVQLCAQLSHPNIVTIFDFGRTSDGTFYYAMELLDGASVERVVEVTGPQPPARVIHILRDVAKALAEAHRHGMIHRDIKPANIVLCRYGGQTDVAKVVDFGLVKQTDERMSLSAAEGSDEEASDMDTDSQTSGIAGTPAYMSPEAYLHTDRVDARSDIYALGAVGYYLLTGRQVFTGHTVAEIVTQHLQTPPEPPSRHCDTPIPEALEQLVMQCLRKRPGERPGSAGELVVRLTEIAGDLAPGSEWQPDDWWSKYGHLLKAAETRARGRSASQEMTVDVDLGYGSSDARESRYSL